MSDEYDVDTMLSEQDAAGEKGAERQALSTRFASPGNEKLSPISAWFERLPKNASIGLLDAAIATAHRIGAVATAAVTPGEDLDAAAKTGSLLPVPVKPEAPAWMRETDTAVANFRDSLIAGSGTSDDIAQGLTQFMVPFLGWSKYLGVADRASKLGKVGMGVVAESAAVSHAFEAHGGRMADLVQLGKHSEGLLGRALNTLAPDGSAISAFINYMTDRENESESAGVLKNIIDNFAASAVIGGLFFVGAKGLKAGHKFLQDPAPASVVPPAEVAPARAEPAPKNPDLDVIDNVQEQIIPDEFVVPGSTVIKAGKEGFLAFAPGEANNLVISRSTLKDEAQGKGTGQRMLLRAAEIAKERGKVLNSDDSVSTAQLYVYESLRKKGKLAFEYSNPEAVAEALKGGVRNRVVKGKGRPVVTNIRVLEEPAAAQ